VKWASVELPTIIEPPTQQIWWMHCRLNTYDWLSSPVQMGYKAFEHFFGTRRCATSAGTHRGWSATASKLKDCIYKWI
jgi:hypothetical protein